MRHPLRYFNSSPEVTRLAVMIHLRYWLSLWQVGDILFEQGMDICTLDLVECRLWRAQS